MDMNALSKAARSAALRGGPDGWGQVASARGHVRYAERLLPP